MRRYVLFGLVFAAAFLSGQAWAQPVPSILWQKCLGGSADEYAYKIIQTSDGGFAVAGYTDSQDGNVSGNHGGEDGWIVKLDSAGAIQWAKCYGGAESDYLYSIVQTSDGGYAVAGLTYSNDGQVSGNHGGGDAWVLKLDDTGKIQWQNCLGGTTADAANSIFQTSDGGFAVAGYTNSDDGNVSGNNGTSDFWVVRLSGTGTLLWQKCLGGSQIDIANSIVQTSDGGFAVAGYTRSNDSEVSGHRGPAGTQDFWVVRLDDTGAIIWQKCLGGTRDDVATSVIQTFGGNFAVTGYTDSNDSDVSGNHGFGNDDFWVIKVDGTDGRLLWQKCLGGSYTDHAFSIVQTKDSGFAVAGSTTSNDQQVSDNHGGGDEWIAKLNDTGKIQWERCLGGTSLDQPYSIVQTKSGNYAIAGFTSSNDSDVTNNHGGEDVWVVELGNPDPPIVSYITPDAGAPGMCVAVEIIAPYNAQANYFGTDGTVFPPDSLVRLTSPTEQVYMRLGPSVVSWNGRVIQQMILIEPGNYAVPRQMSLEVFQNGSGAPSAPFYFWIVAPYDLGTLSGGGVILGPRTNRNTLVVDSLILENGTYTAPTLDPDASTPGNQAYLPFRILSLGPIRLSNATISANGNPGITGTGGGNGGPGGGGGGAGYPGAGGAGFTGGGGDNDGSSGPGGVGTGPNNSTAWYGGLSLDSAHGASGEQHSGSGGDDGGGGGTGHPFGTSGANGNNSNSPAGGYGGASAGGSTSTYLTNYGGGGGGNEAPGGNGGGSSGANGGQVVGNSMLVPLFGGSGGGAGNCTHITTEEGGSGGGGGGAIELTSFASITVPNGSSIISNGGNGSNGKAGLESGAGGGGGAGGAISISARDSIVIGSSTLMAENGGAGGTGQNNGGTGGVGRLRINGYVSKFSSPHSDNYFNPTHGYTGPSIQRVTYTADSAIITGYAEYWDGLPSSPGKLEVFTAWPSTGWDDTLVTPLLDPASHTAKWVRALPISRVPGDSELYVAVVQNDTAINGTFADVPNGIMSHTSGIISKVVGPPLDSIQPMAVNFGNQLVGKCSKDTTIEIYSIGVSPLVVDSAKLLGKDASQFKIVSSFPISVSAGNSFALLLQYCPDSIKCPMTATLRVYMNDTTKDIALTGCGVQPEMIIKPIVLEFGRIHIGACKDTFVTVTNPGTDTLTITAELIQDPRFTAVGSFPIIVPPDSSVLLMLRFCPTDTIIHTAGDSVIGDAPQSPVVLIFQGEGKIGILSEPSIFDLGAVSLDSCKDSLIYARNIGNDTLILERDPISPSGFTSSAPTLPVVLQPNDSIAIDVRFCSTDTGSFIATMTLGTDIPSTSPVTLLAHTGIGILQMLTTIDFGSVAIGGCADTNIELKNIGTGTLILLPDTNIKPPFYYNGPTPIVLAPGATDTIKLRFCPTDTNEDIETTQFDTIGAGTSVQFVLKGKGIEGALSTSVSKIDIGCIAIGNSDTATVIIQNTGAATMQNLIASVTPGITIVHNPSTTLGADAEDSVVLIIPAQALGNFSGTLTFTWTGGTPVTVPITAFVSVPPQIESLDTVIQFDSINVGDSSVRECILITNLSCIPLPVNQITISGARAGEFEIVSSNASPYISDSTVVTICIKYKPLYGGNSTAKVILISAGDTIPVTTLLGFGNGTGVGVELAIDTVAGRPGDIVNVPVRTLNDVTAGAISSVTFRVTFNPMQLDLKAPLAPTTSSIQSANTPTYTTITHSIGDKEITGTFPTALTGTPVIAELPFEILEPTANTATLHLVSASFGNSISTLASTSDGLIQIEQCDTNERIALVVSPIDVAPNNPNPFADRTAITVNVQTAGHLKLEVYNALGQKVLVPFNADVPVGTQTIEIDASSLPSGAYRYITTWTWQGANPPNYQPTVARDEKTMIVLGE